MDKILHSVATNQIAGFSENSIQMELVYLLYDQQMVQLRKKLLNPAVFSNQTGHLCLVSKYKSQSQSCS